MKQVFLLLGLLTWQICYAQPKSSAEADTMNVFLDLAKTTGYEGKKLSVLSEYFKARHTKIHYFSFNSTSPYIDPKGKCYLKRIQVGYLTAKEMDYRVSNENKWVLILDITLEPPYTVDTDMLLHCYPLGDTRIDAERRFAMIQDKFTIKSIKCWYIRPMK